MCGNGVGTGTPKMAYQPVRLLQVRLQNKDTAFYVVVLGILIGKGTCWLHQGVVTFRLNVATTMASALSALQNNVG